MLPITKIKDIYPLSPLQAGLIFHAVYDETSTYYFEQISYRLKKRLYIKHIRKSLEILFDRHDILRTAFTYEDVSKPLQIVLKEREVDFYYEDKRRLERGEAERRLDNFKMEDRKRSFNLKKDPLLRASLLRLGEDEFEVVWSFHHIILDGWSVAVLNSEFWEIYDAIAADRKPSLPSPIQYKSYIKWLEKRDGKNDIKYWVEHLSGYSKLASIPRRFQTGSYAANEYDFSLGEVLTKSLENIAQKNNVTLNVIMQSIWGIILAKYNNSRDVVFGTIVSGRPSSLKGVESMVGMFINAIPVRIQYCPDTSFSQLAGQAMNNCINAEKYQYCSLAEIQASCRNSNLLDHIIVFENYPVGVNNKNTNEGAKTTVTNTRKFTQTNYDLNIIVVPGNEVKIRLNYNSNVYRASFIQDLAIHFFNIASQVAGNRHINIDSIELLSDNEKNKILLEFNNTTTKYPEYHTIQEIFEEQALKSPDDIAILFTGKGLTYRELNEKSNQLAHYLRKKGVKEESLVGICMERSLFLMVGLLGILKAGGAYVPIDPDYPENRLDYMIKDSDMSIIISDRDHIRLAKNLEEKSVVVLNANWFSGRKESKTNLKTNAKHNSAYVIYTSGSTGKPKGVVNTHGGIVNRLLWTQEFFKLNKTDSVLQKTTICFDVSVWELFWPLLVGSKLIFARPGGHRDVEYLKDIIEEYNITTIHFVPSMLEIFLQALTSNKCKSLKRVLCSGEALAPSQVTSFNHLLPAARLYNLYGPTEAAIDVAYWAAPKDDKTLKTVPIGRPVANTQIYILDKTLKSMPVGVTGELYIGGVQLARGYLNRPDLTRQRFIPNPFGQKGSVIYGTGDLGRWLPDGNLEFIGRVDDQVKIRGNRIELGEIQNVLNDCECVKQGIVTAREDKNGNKRLIGYAAPNGTFDKQSILRRLRSQLPEYMIPSALIEIKKIPLTPNGKVDKKALPDLEIEELTREFAPPRNRAERFLVNVWNELLHTDKVGIYDNFFEVGGHSLTALLVTSRLLKEFKIKIDLKTFFDHPTIADLSDIVNSSERQEVEDIKPLKKAPYYELSHAQKGLWITSQFQDAQTTFNIPIVYQMNESIDRGALEKSFESLLKRHESLRTTFIQIEHEPKQKIHSLENLGFKIQFIDLAGKDDNHIQADHIAYKEALTPFNLEKRPLLRVTLVKLGSANYKILITIHHIIADFLSVQNLINEVMELYKGIKAGKLKSPPKLRVQYKDYAAWHTNIVNQNLSRYKTYWMNKFADGPIPILKLPTDYARPKKLGNRGRFAECQLDVDTSNAVKKKSKELGVTTFITLLTASFIFLYKYSGQNDLVLGTPVSGRDHRDLENQIGIFVNMLPLRKKISGATSFKELLNEVKDDAYDAFAHQVYPYDLLVHDLGLVRDPSRNPLFDFVVTFDVLEGAANQDDQNGNTDKIFNVCKYDVRIRFSEFSDIIAINILYNADLFKYERMEIFKERFVSLIKDILSDIEKTIDEYDYQISAEKSENADIVSADFDFQF